MKKLAKVLAVIVAVVLVCTAGLALLVHYVITEDRIKAFVIPEAERVTGRKVELGAIQIGLFQGIALHNFGIKEADGTTDFFKAKSFVLSYDLWPLLERRLVISQIRLENPTLRIVRDSNGKFNFQSLAILEKEKAEKEDRHGPPSSEEAPKALALPIALTVDRISVDDAQVEVRDALGEIPNTDASFNLGVGLSLGQKINYQGKMDFKADATYGKMKPHVAGSATFDPSRATYDIQAEADGEKARFTGDVANWNERPRVKLDITSDRIDLDHLLGLAATMSKGPGKGGNASGNTPTAKGQPAAPPLDASGKVDITQVLYHGLDIRNFALTYSLEKGVVKIADLKAEAADGTVAGKAETNLTQSPLPYSGTCQVNGLNVEKLVAAFAPKMQGKLSGTAQADVTFSGSGTEWSQARDRLNAQGTYSLRDGAVAETPVTTAIANVIGFPQLANLNFQNIDGNLRIENGNVFLKSLMHGKDVQISTDGTVGLDGKLDLPVDITLSGDNAESFKKRSPLAQALTTSSGDVEARLKLAGTVSRPYPTLDTKAVEEKVKETVKKEVTKQLEKALSGQKTQESGQTEPQKEAPVENLLKGILGK